MLPPRPDWAAVRAMADAARPSGAGEPVLTCRGLSCRRGDRRVLRDINLVLRRGEIVGLSGPNGAGKSTLLLALAGGLKTTCKDQIEWHARAGSGRAVERPFRLFPDVALLMQNPLQQLFCDTVRQESALAAENAGLAGVAERVRGLLAAADLGGLADRAVLSLSYGEQQRTALAAAMSAGPAVALLDEPTHGMDADRLDRLVRLVMQARSEGTVFVVASHDAALLGALCDRILVLRDGRLE